MLLVLADVGLKSVLHDTTAKQVKCGALLIYGVEHSSPPLIGRHRLA